MRDLFLNLLQRRLTHHQSYLCDAILRPYEIMTKTESFREGRSHGKMTSLKKLGDL